MSDISETYEWFKSEIVPHIRRTREKRLKKFHQQVGDFIKRMAEYGIDVRLLDGGEQVQLSFKESIANYYPRTRSYFMQKPGPSPTRKIDFESVLEQFIEDVNFVEEARRLGILKD